MKHLTIIMAIIMLTGCTHLGLQPPPSVCEQPGAEKSLICDVCTELGTTPEVADLLIESAAIRALDDTDKTTVLKFYESVELFLSTTQSYRSLIEFVQNYVDMTGPEVILISMYLPRFDSTQFISSFDRDLLMMHIYRMRAILQ